MGSVLTTLSCLLSLTYDSGIRVWPSQGLRSLGVMRVSMERITNSGTKRYGKELVSQENVSDSEVSCENNTSYQIWIDLWE